MSKEHDLTEGVTALWAGHFQAQERRLAAQEQAVVALVAGTLDEPGLQAAQQAAHKLAGSLGTFGLEEGSRLAAQIEATWHEESIDYAGVGRLANVVASLRALLETHRPAADVPPHSLPQSMDAGEDIWLVDDDDVFARYVLEPLKRRYRVAWLDSGESALAMVARTAEAQYPKLILLDIEMPGMKGLSVLEQLTEQGVADRSAVVMLTRRSAVEDVVRARQLGAIDFLAKPISVSTLTQRVTRALETLR